MKVYQNPFLFAGKVIVEERDARDYKQSSKRALESNKRGEIDLRSLRVCGFPPIKHNPEKVMVSGEVGWKKFGWKGGRVEGVGWGCVGREW